MREWDEDDQDRILTLTRTTTLSPDPVSEPDSIYKDDEGALVAAYEKDALARYGSFDFLDSNQDGVIERKESAHPRRQGGLTKRRVTVARGQSFSTPEEDDEALLSEVDATLDRARSSISPRSKRLDFIDMVRDMQTAAMAILAGIAALQVRPGASYSCSIFSNSQCLY